MAEVPGVSAVPEQQPPEQTTQAAGSEGTVPATLPANATLADLEKVAKPLADAIKTTIAWNICGAANRSNQRVKETLREAERQQRSR